MKFSRHYFGLALAIALGTIFRFWNLDYKPLWLDEVITALFTLGKSYNDVPLDVVFPLNQLAEIFTFNSSVNCPQISQNIASQSTHPPLFFCLMHYWLANLDTHYSSLITQLRSLPALFGVAAIAAVYFLTRVAFFREAGLMAAAFMAVSPFGVYISQEARHYTLPVLLITLSLLGLIQIQQDCDRQKVRPIVWLTWVIVNAIGLYVHYFFILALIAEFVTFLLIFYKAKPQKIKYFFPALALLCWLLPFILFIPWLPALVGHFSRPETSWLPPPYNIAPLYQIVAAWILMAIAFPVESQPIWIIIPAALLMLVFAGCLGWQIFQGIKQLINNQTTQLATLTLGIFSIFVLIEFLAIVYFLGKDITIAPRYHFVYYPAFCALVGGAIANKKSLSATQSPLLLVGVISCIFVVWSLAFLKPYNPQKVAQDMLREPNVPLMVVVGYKDSQDVALGMSFALAIDKYAPDRCKINAEKCPKFAFYNRNSGYDSVWQKLSQLPTPIKLPLNLWVVAPGFKRQSYPENLAISSQTTCKIDPTNYYRIGIPYQLYRCN